MWNIIFGYVTDPIDLSNILLASPEGWDNLLKSSKVSFLMPSVLPVVSTYLDKSSILSCRKVCRLWKSSVDTFLQRHPCIINLDGVHHDKEDPLHDPQEVCWQRSAKSFHSPEVIHEFLISVDNLVHPYLGGNPLVTRAVIVGDHMRPQPEAHEEMWTAIRLLLGAFGSHIWHFRLLSTAQRSGPTYFNLIHECLSSLPNLRTLDLCIPVKPGDIMSHQCEELIRSRGLPELDHLVTLKANYIPSVLLNPILDKYKSRLEKVQLCTPQWFAQLCDYDESIPLENLDQLSIPLRFTLDIWKVERSHWLRTVKSLSLDISFHNFYSKSDLQKLFDMLESEGGHVLQNLNLELSVSALQEKGKTCVDKMARLRLPLLKKLRIHAKHVNFNTIDFILGAPGLRELTLHLQDSEPPPPPSSSSLQQKPGVGGAGDRPEVIKFAGHIEDMYDSNIWELMPKLEKLVIRIRDLCFRYRVGEDFTYLRKWADNHNHNLLHHINDDGNNNEDRDDKDKAKMPYQNEVS